MTGRLQGKVAIVTGGSRGQGASHVRAFIKEGAKVAFTDVRVELGPGTGAELRQCLGEAAGLRLVVRPGERLEGIDTGENARGERNGVAGQSVGIPAPVPPFMMVPDDVRRGVEEVDVTEHGVPGVRM